MSFVLMKHEIKYSTGFMMCRKVAAYRTDSGYQIADKEFFETGKGERVWQKIIVSGWLLFNCLK
jgi:hypothetical protein